MNRRQFAAAAIAFLADPVYNYVLDFKSPMKREGVEKLLESDVSGVEYVNGSTDSQRRRWTVTLKTRRNKHRVLDDLKDLPEVSRARLK